MFMCVCVCVPQRRETEFTLEQRKNKVLNINLDLKKKKSDFVFTSKKIIKKKKIKEVIKKGKNLNSYNINNNSKTSNV